MRKLTPEQHEAYKAGKRAWQMANRARRAANARRYRAEAALQKRIWRMLTSTPWRTE